MIINRTRFTYASLAVIAACLVWILYTKNFPPSREPTLPPSAQKGFPAPDFTLTTLSGDTIHLSDFKGKPVILNVWASWCSPCKEEMPALQKVYSDMETKGLIVLGGNMTFQDSRDSVVEFVRQYQLTFPILLDENAELGQTYLVQALPSTYFIGADGIIQDVIIGGPLSEADFRSQAERMLKDKP